MDLEERKLLKDKLNCKIKANKISRLPIKKQEDVLKDLKKTAEKEKGYNKEKLNTIINIIEEKQEIADNARINRTFADYGGGFENGGGGSGTDSG
jgi:hypothetical protein